MQHKDGLKPCSEACERNKHAILQALERIFAEPGKVLEIGSGTGQHAVFFATHLPHLDWQCSDLAGRHPGINAWLDDEGPGNVRAPIKLDVRDYDWSTASFDYAFSANTAHIMSWRSVGCMFAGLGQAIRAGGIFALYGPFCFSSGHTSESNRRFDEALRSEDRQMGIRKFEDLVELGSQTGFSLRRDMPMPANNRLLVFERT